MMASFRSLDPCQTVIAVVLLFLSATSADAQQSLSDVALLHPYASPSVDDFHEPLAAPILVTVTRQTSVAPSSPQPGSASTNRGFVSVNAVLQVASNDFSDSRTFTKNAERAVVNTDYTIKAGPAFDVSGGVIVWRSLAAGLGVTRFSRSMPTAISASVPHPFFFDQSRSITGEVSGLKREELAVHIQARAVVPVGRCVRVMVFGGPSFFTVEQALVNEVESTDSYPYRRGHVQSSGYQHSKEVEGRSQCRW